MTHTTSGAAPAKPRVLSRAPAELTSHRLRRLGEGIEKVVYASDRWVVKRVRAPSEAIALIALWKMLRSVQRLLPRRLGARLLQRPSRQIRFLSTLIRGLMWIFPRSIWFTAHLWDIWKQHHLRDLRGQGLAKSCLSGTSLIPEIVTFPPTIVEVDGWPGWLTVSEATERVEGTLEQRLEELAQAERFEELEAWLNRFLDLRTAGWQRGVFSVDAHLKNFGVSGDHVVLLDPGGLTDRWSEIEEQLDSEHFRPQPHVQLGLAPMLQSRPDIAARFDARWKATVNHAEVRRRWLSSKIPDERAC
jgi:hypothetical protein